jgi:UDP-3-O-[3-hydroxymyristoyl] glucosamine N-acyltransferase
MERLDSPPLWTLAGLIDRFGGDSTGGANTAIASVAPLDRAGPRDLAFFANPRYRPQLASTAAACVLISEKEKPGALAAPSTALWFHANPYATFARVAQLLAPVATPAIAGIHSSAVIEEGAVVDPSASIGAHCVIGRGAVIGKGVVLGAGSTVGAFASIGSASLLHARVSVYHDCVVGERCILHSGVVIGADGFGFAPDQGEWIKIPQTGRAVIGNDVEIGANTTIDRGTMGDTTIGDGAKLDNQIQIGHNCDIGPGTVMAGCSAVAGSTRIGAQCLIGGAAMIIGHLSIADHVSISVGTVVSHSIHRAGFYTGFFPMSDNASWEKNAVLVRQLDRMRKRLKALEEKLKDHQGGTT